jgi:hypothetical protein
MQGQHAPGIEMEDWVGNAASAAGAAIITVLGAIGVARLNAKPAGKTADAAGEAAGAAVQVAINAGFEILTKAMRAEMDELRGEVTRMSQTIAAQDATIQEQTGELRNLSQHVVSLEKVLRDNGIDVPERPVVASVLAWEPPDGSGIVKLNQDTPTKRKGRQ